MRKVVENCMIFIPFITLILLPFDFAEFTTFTYTKNDCFVQLLLSVLLLRSFKFIYKLTGKVEAKVFQKLITVESGK